MYGMADLARIALIENVEHKIGEAGSRVPVGRILPDHLGIACGSKAPLLPHHCQLLFRTAEPADAE